MTNKPVKTMSRAGSVLGTGITFQRATTLTVSAPLTLAHAAGAQVSGTGITLTAALTKAHASGMQVGVSLPTPGAPNRYDGARR